MKKTEVDKSQIMLREKKIQYNYIYLKLSTINRYCIFIWIYVDNSKIYVQMTYTNIQWLSSKRRKGGEVGFNFV